MKILEKNFYPLKNGHLFAILEVRGKKGEKVDIVAEGVSNELIFFHEAPKTMHNCVYFADENIIELGGAEMETERTLYLIAEPK